jgi:long-chain acyl-CoA synthetase
MTLRDHLDRAVSGAGGFRVSEAGGRAAPSGAVDVSRHRGRPVLWPLGNDANAVWTFCRALCDGTVPVIVPKSLPPVKREGLLQAFPDFAVFDDGVVHDRGRAAAIDRRVFLAVLTSGSTGEPRAVAVSEANLERGVEAIHAAQALHDVASTGVVLSLAYAYALVNQLFWAVRFERSVWLPGELRSLVLALPALRAAGARMLCLVPAQARQLATLGIGAAAALPAVEVVNFGGAPFPLDTYDHLGGVFPRATLYNNYGCTEAMPRLTVASVTSATDRVTRVGRPVGDIELRIIGEDPVGPVAFRGSSTSIGVLQPDGSLRPHPEWIASGDLGSLIEGELHVYGRHDQIFNVAGERHSVIEIEQVLLSLGADEAVVWVERRGDGEEEVVAVVRGVAFPEGRALGRALRAHLVRAAWPRRTFLADPWPLLPNGKPDRMRLQELARSGRLPVVWRA